MNWSTNISVTSDPENPTSITAIRGHIRRSMYYNPRPLRYQNSTPRDPPPPSSLECPGLWQFFSVKSEKLAVSPLQEVDNGGQDSRPLGRCCVNSVQSWAQKIIFEQIVNERRRIVLCCVRRECGQKPYYVERAEQLLVFSAIYCREHLFISYWTWGQASSPRIQTRHLWEGGGDGQLS